MGLPPRGVKLTDERPRMDVRQLDMYWSKLVTEERDSRVGKLADWDRANFDKCFEVYECLESLVSSPPGTATLEGMQVIPGDPRAGHSRFSVITYSRF